MTFPAWRQLNPGDAARELRERAHASLSPAQQRAVFSFLPDENQLATHFAAARGTGVSPVNASPLSAVPFVAKDLFDFPGIPTLAGSTFLPEVRPTPPRESAIIRAFRSAGAVFAGKTHLHEFAYGITGENPHYGDCEHPHFPGRTTGGSSSGSAAAVAAGIVPLALGSDTGGSVRVPAAFCGLFGFRLAPRDAWIADAFPLAPTFDTAGWFTANAADMRATIAALIGLKPATTRPRGLYLELPVLDPDVTQACRAAAARFSLVTDTATIAHLIAGFARSVDTYNTIVAVEAWDVHKSWAERFRERYDPGVWQRLNRVHAISPGQIDAARTDLANVVDLWKSYFHTYDFLILPASPTPALTKAECTLANRTRILTLTAPASLGGLPVLTIPLALPSGLTTGLQIIVNHAKSPVIDWALNS